MNNDRRRKNAVKNAIGIFIIFTGIAYAAYSVHRGKTGTQKLCAQVEIGKDVDIYERRAEELNLKLIHLKREKDTARPNVLMAWGGFAFARLFCEIEFDDGGIVTGKKRTYLD